MQRGTRRKLIALLVVGILAALAYWGLVDEALEPAPELVYVKPEGRDPTPFLDKARDLVRGKLEPDMRPAAIRREFAEALKLIDEVLDRPDAVILADSLASVEFVDAGPGVVTVSDPLDDLLDALFKAALDRLEAPASWRALERSLSYAALEERATARDNFAALSQSYPSRWSPLVWLRGEGSRWPKDARPLRRLARDLQALSRRFGPPREALRKLQHRLEAELERTLGPEGPSAVNRARYPEPESLGPERFRWEPYHVHLRRSKNALRRFARPYVRALDRDQQRLAELPRVPAERVEELEQHPEAEGLRRLLSRNAIGRRAALRGAIDIQDFVTRWAQGALINEAAATELAIRAFQLEQGRSPQSLSELVPGILPELPRDLYSGEALRYDPERGILYSLGIDGRDQGGLPDSPALVVPSAFWSLRNEDWLKEPTFFLERKRDGRKHGSK